MYELLGAACVDAYHVVVDVLDAAVVVGVGAAVLVVVVDVIVVWAALLP